MRSIFAWLPQEAYPALIVLLAVGLIVGLITRQRAFALLGLIILLALLKPFISALFHSLPWSIALLLIIFFFFGITRAALNLLFGRRATDHFVGECMFAFFSLPFRMVAYLFRPRRGI